MAAVPPEIVLVPDSVQVQEGSILNLVCMATGEPRPHVSWFLNDSLVSLSIVSLSAKLCVYVYVCVYVCMFGLCVYVCA